MKEKNLEGRWKSVLHIFPTGKSIEAIVCLYCVCTWDGVKKMNVNISNIVFIQNQSWLMFVMEFSFKYFISLYIHVFMCIIIDFQRLDILLGI